MPDKPDEPSPQSLIIMGSLNSLGTFLYSFLPFFLSEMTMKS